VEKEVEEEEEEEDGKSLQFPKEAGGGRRGAG
jgi:hypothetical protein